MRNDPQGTPQDELPADVITPSQADAAVADGGTPELPEPEPVAEPEPESVTLRVASPTVTEFVFFGEPDVEGNDVPYAVTQQGTDVPVDLADKIITSALSVGIVVVVNAKG